MRSIVLRLAPSAVIAGALLWCCWPYLQSDAPTFDPNGPASLPEIDLAQLQQGQQSDCERDPFRPLRALVQMVETAAAPMGTAGDLEPSIETPPPVDPEKAIQRLTLNATLIRGARRRAIIDGQSYQEGDQVPAPASISDPFLIEQIAAHQVTIEHDGKRYTLTYRDTLPPRHPTPCGTELQQTPTHNPNPNS